MKKRAESLFKERAEIIINDTDQELKLSIEVRIVGDTIGVNRRVHTRQKIVGDSIDIQLTESLEVVNFFIEKVDELRLRGVSVGDGSVRLKALAKKIKTELLNYPGGVGFANQAPASLAKLQH